MARRSANLSLDEALLAEAKALDVDLSKSAEEGIRAAVARSKVAQWQAENANGNESYNRFVDDNGLPLKRFRGF